MARPLGAVNKIGAAVKSNVIAVFDKIGGREGMAEWARKNRTDFYRLYARLIPTESVTEIVRRDAAELSDAELADIATASRAGTDSPQASETKPSGVH